ncbi:hypothetical protein Desor_2220 [Desulfosporosinus orientis DSM 765]|uniref:Uncharacterized protein n=1 Tax=Desulfosporosinus orientis (strain ATCC 19365 / DSM 765 / NCIMB 8382 / VKM B-1628 / Singapore I) TaxID=768706 RepID=G7W8W2_DESOD|nr:hypothetical protein [Desulfosporosinus orientis]AET67822.1 hypothetical protein Desor_2220 [Desulfosporosinus orientis DSM 765]
MDKEEEKLSNKEDENMNGAVKNQGYRKTSLSSQKLKEISVRPVTIKDGKFLFDRNNKDHRYIVNEGE